MNPAITLLRVERDKKQRHLDELMEVVRQARAEVRAYDDAIALLEGGLPSTPPATSSGVSSSQAPLKALVADILKDRPGLSPSQITEALDERGRPTGLNTVLGTLSRARQEGLVHKMGRVWYWGAGNFTRTDVQSESIGAPDRSEAPAESRVTEDQTGAAETPEKGSSFD